MATTTIERVHFNLYVDRDVRRALERMARANDRSVSAEARVALRAYIERDEEEDEGA